MQTLITQKPDLSQAFVEILSHCRIEGVKIEGFIHRIGQLASNIFGDGRKPEFLGEGSYANVFHIGNSLVVKVSTDPCDAVSSYKAKGRSLKNVVNTLDVFKVVWRGDVWYVIINEYAEKGCPKKSGWLWQYLHDHWGFVQNCYTTGHRPYYSKQQFLWGSAPEQVASNWIEGEFSDQMHNIFTECAQLGLIRMDVNKENFIWTKDERLVYIDLGYCSSSRDENEFIINKLSKIEVYGNEQWSKAIG